VEELFAKFSANNPDGKLDKDEFVRLYTSLRPEKPERLDEISVQIFRAFDRNGDNSITFSEFLVSYALTARGDLRKKLEYAFDMYDSDRNHTLDYNEVLAVIAGMLDLLGADKAKHNVQEIAKSCFSQLDSSNDGKVTKEEFIQGLLNDYSLRALMQPFS
jgi:Ca2+-binding EF-hand superfamily protein